MSNTLQAYEVLIQGAHDSYQSSPRLQFILNLKLINNCLNDVASMSKSLQEEHKKIRQAVVRIMSK